MTTVGVLLAAGHSRRFGADDKLMAIFDGMPLICHAAESLRGCVLDHRIAVVRNRAVGDLLSGFQIVNLPDDDSPQSDSLVSGIHLAKKLGASRALVMLGDMPDVTHEHLQQILLRADQLGQSCSGDGQKRLPPACFSSDQFDTLLGLSGDRGAGQVLKEMTPDQVVIARSEELKDVDRAEDIR